MMKNESRRIWTLLLALPLLAVALGGCTIIDAIQERNERLARGGGEDESLSLPPETGEPQDQRVLIYELGVLGMD